MLPLRVRTCDALNVAAVDPPVAIVITSEPENVILVFASASPVIESREMLPTLFRFASLISKSPVTSKSPLTVRFPANVALAPLPVSIVVVPDLIIKLALVFVNPPKVVPSSFNIISAPPASNTISVVASSVIVDPESISVITGVVKVLLVSVCVAAFCVI